MSLGVSSWILRRCFGVYERAKSFKEQSPKLGPDELPLPSATLRVRVAGTASVEVFLHGGQLAADTVRELLAKNARPSEHCSAILDFGCGCGRVLRHWKGLAGTELYGTDFNPELVAWCGDHLPFAKVSENALEPPTRFHAEQFDAIYAFSVFTHMPGDVQKRWMDEFRRILKPDGLLIFSTHGRYYLPKLRDGERREFERGQLVVRFGAAAGSNLCSTFHAESYVRNELARGWEIAEFVAEGARGNPRQDAWVFRRINPCNGSGG